MKEFKYIIIPITIIILSQLLKVIIEWIRTKEFSFSRFTSGMGGMPSSHCAFVSSITTLICINCGMKSPMFGVCFAFLLITIFDAIGIRYEAEKHASILNRIVKANLKENLGHETIEVLVGIIFGTLLTIFLNHVI